MQDASWSRLRIFHHLKKNFASGDDKFVVVDSDEAGGRAIFGKAFEVADEQLKRILEFYAHISLAWMND